ncbi:MAG: PD40 domain-containing protein [Gemmatimonadetes bacterium]|nr:PD40 domain-containing protein [Gemmatimonadota bacterium]
MVLGLAACSDSTAPNSRNLAQLQLYALTPATVRSLVVEVTGPGISPPLVVNIPVDSVGVASGSLSVLPGTGRHVVVSALDTSGIVSHRADTTVTLVAGANSTINLVLKPLVASVPIIVTFGTVLIDITSGPTVMAAGDTASFGATVTGVFGSVPADSVRWGSSDPSVLAFTGRRATALRSGSVMVTASFRGATASRAVAITAAVVSGTFLLEQTRPTCCAQLATYALPAGTATVTIPPNSGQGDLSPDRSAVAYWRPFDNRIFRAAADGTGEVILASGAVNYSPRWGAAGTMLVFTREVGGGEGSREIYVMNADGSGQVRLTTNASADEQPHLSPDGSKIVFVSSRDGNAEIYAMNSDGSGQVRLTTAPGFDGSPSWSPDGTRIAFTSDRSGALEIHTMAPDGSGVTQLTFASGSPPAQVARWSPDGSRLSFVRTVGGRTAPWTVRADGSDAQLLRLPPAGVVFEFVASWRAP